MNLFVGTKADNLRRVLGIVLFSMLIGLGVYMAALSPAPDPLGWVLVVAGAFALVFWLVVGGRRGRAV